MTTPTAAMKRKRQSKFAAGQFHEVAYPFVRELVSLFDGEGPADTWSWRPGVRYELVPPDDSEAIADGLGQVSYTVVATFKPGSFPERVFYTRRWRAPDGREFGKSCLHIATAAKFTGLLTGYRHEFRQATAAETAKLIEARAA